MNTSDLDCYAWSWSRMKHHNVPDNGDSTLADKQTEQNRMAVLQAATRGNLPVQLQDFAEKPTSIADDSGQPRVDREAPPPEGTWPEFLHDVASDAAQTALGHAVDRRCESVQPLRRNAPSFSLEEQLAQ